jgi:hypothetical protein
MTHLNLESILTFCHFAPVTASADSMFGGSAVEKKLAPPRTNWIAASFVF